MKSIVDEVEDKLRESGAKPIRREGQRDGRWVLIDYGEIVVHVQHEEERAFYALERLWRDCPTIDLPRRRRLARAVSGPRRLILLRHGRTAWNHVLRVQGHTDVGLDDTGHAQAAGVAPTVAAMAPSLLWTSDLARAWETAAPVAAATGLAAVPDARLREFSLGEREGLTTRSTSRPRRLSSRGSSRATTTTCPAPRRSTPWPPGWRLSSTTCSPRSAPGRPASPSPTAARRGSPSARCWAGARTSSARCAGCATAPGPSSWGTPAGGPLRLEAYNRRA